MLKIISLVAATVLLSSCFTSEEHDQKVSTKSSTVDAEENIVKADYSRFESQQYDGSYSREDAPNSAVLQNATAELKDEGVEFVLYFSYDDSEIDEAATQTIIKHANFMRDNPELNLRLEGHADERGTREYNLALGENRALAVKEVLGLYDLDSRIAVISFGEEMPLVRNHDESAWGKNRRVEFVYQ